MKLKNTLFSIIRHVLTATGGAVIANNPNINENVIQTAVGGIIALIGVIWGAKDEHTAENK